MCDLPDYKGKAGKDFKEKKRDKMGKVDCEPPEVEFPQIVTMVKWSRPILLTEYKGRLGRVPFPKGGYVEYKVPPGFPLRPKIPGLLGPPPTLEDMGMTTEETARILDIIFKPKTWQEGSRQWIQKVSPLPAKRNDVINLAEELRVRLIRQDARPRGICHTRQHLFFQCFDEIIREVTVNCSERGLLLLNVRDELQLILLTYVSLVEQAKEFGHKKFEMVKSAEEELQETYEKLLKDKINLEAENQDCRLKIQDLIRVNKNRRKSMERTRSLRLAYLQRSNDQFFYMLDNIGMDKKLFFHLMT